MKTNLKLNFNFSNQFFFIFNFLKFKNFFYFYFYIFINKFKYFYKNYKNFLTSYIFFKNIFKSKKKNIDFVRIFYKKLNCFNNLIPFNLIFRNKNIFLKNHIIYKKEFYIKFFFYNLYLNLYYIETHFFKKIMDFRFKKKKQIKFEKKKQIRIKIYRQLKKYRKKPKNLKYKEFKKKLESIKKRLKKKNKIKNIFKNNFKTNFFKNYISINFNFLYLFILNRNLNKEYKINSYFIKNNDFIVNNQYPIIFLKNNNHFLKNFNFKKNFNFLKYYNIYVTRFFEFFFKNHFFIKINIFKDHILDQHLNLIKKNYKNMSFTFDKSYKFNNIIEIIWISFYNKDLSFLKKWFKKNFKKISVKNHKKFLNIFKKLIFENFYKYKTILNIEGFFLLIKGKINLTGNAKKSFYLIKIGKFKLSSKKIKIDHQIFGIRTESGELGFNLILSYN